MVSIIIPAYNAEKYISRCIDSILLQPFKDFEVIIVNDGSHDNTEGICREYSKKYSNIKYYSHDKQMGASTARNTGLCNAEGEYLCFVDIDDELCKNAIEILVNSIDGNDMVIGSYYNVYTNKTIPVTLSPKSYTMSEFKDEMMPIYTIGAINTVWGKLFKREIVEEFSVRFNPDITLGEDLLFVLDYIRNIKNITTIDNYVYKYYRNENGISGLRSKKALNDCFKQHYAMVEFLDGKNIIAENDFFVLKITRFLTAAVRQAENKCYILKNYFDVIAGYEDFKYIKVKNVQSKIICAIIKNRLSILFLILMYLKTLSKAIIGKCEG